MDNKTKSNYNNIEYCLGNGLELLSTPTVFAVCQDSSVFRTRNSIHIIQRQLPLAFHTSIVFFSF